MIFSNKEKSMKNKQLYNKFYCIFFILLILSIGIPFPKEVEIIWTAIAVILIIVFLATKDSFKINPEKRPYFLSAKDEYKDNFINELKDKFLKDNYQIDKIKIKNYNIEYLIKNASFKIDIILFLNINNILGNDEKIDSLINEIGVYFKNNKIIKKSKNINVIYFITTKSKNKELIDCLSSVKKQYWSKYYLLSGYCIDKNAIYFEYPKEYNKNTNYTYLSKLFYLKVKDLTYIKKDNS